MTVICYCLKLRLMLKVHPCTYIQPKNQVVSKFLQDLHCLKVEIHYPVWSHFLLNLTVSVATFGNSFWATDSSESSHIISHLAPLPCLHYGCPPFYAVSLRKVDKVFYTAVVCCFCSCALIYNYVLYKLHSLKASL